MEVALLAAEESVSVAEAVVERITDEAVAAAADAADVTDEVISEKSSSSMTHSSPDWIRRDTAEITGQGWDVEADDRWDGNDDDHKLTPLCSYPKSLTIVTEATNANANKAFSTQDQYLASAFSRSSMRLYQVLSSICIRMAR